MTHPTDTRTRYWQPLGCAAEAVIFAAIVLATWWALSELRGCRAQGLKISQSITVGLAAGDVATSWGRADQEANPLMRSVVAHPARMVAVKGAITAGQVWILHKGGKAHPRWALWTSIGANVAQGLVVCHNLRVR